MQARHAKETNSYYQSDTRTQNVTQLNVRAISRTKGNPLVEVEGFRSPNFFLKYQIPHQIMDLDQMALDLGRRQVKLGIRINKILNLRGHRNLQGIQRINGQTYKAIISAENILNIFRRIDYSKTAFAVLSKICYVAISTSGWKNLTLITFLFLFIQ